MLGKRLARHGLVVSGGALATALCQNAASACVPGPLVVSTVQAATLMAAGKALATGAISANVVALTEGVIKAMLLTKLKVTLAVVLALNVIGAGVGLVYCQTAGSGHDGQAGPAVAQEKPNVPVPAGQQSGSQPVMVAARNADTDEKPAAKPGPAATDDEMGLVKAQIKGKLIRKEGVAGYCILVEPSGDPRMIDKLVRLARTEDKQPDLDKLIESLEGKTVIVRGNLIHQNADRNFSMLITKEAQIRQADLKEDGIGLLMAEVKGKLDGIDGKFNHGIIRAKNRVRGVSS